MLLTSPQHNLMAAAAGVMIFLVPECFVVFWVVELVSLLAVRLRLLVWTPQLGPEDLAARVKTTLCASHAAEASCLRRGVVFSLAAACMRCGYFILVVSLLFAPACVVPGMLPVGSRIALHLPVVSPVVTPLVALVLLSVAVKCNNTTTVATAERAREVASLRNSGVWSVVGCISAVGFRMQCSQNAARTPQGHPGSNGSRVEQQHASCRC